MSNCENCEQEHDGSYASGRFCSVKCSRGFSTKINRSKINKKISKSLTGKQSPLKGKSGTSHSPIIRDKISANTKLYFKNNPDILKHLKLIATGKDKSLKTRKKISNSCKGHTGGIRKGGGRGKSGWYKGYWCDSSWELAFVIYNLDHNISFERNKQGFEYMFEGKIYKFYPDFIVNNKYVEIKGWMDKRNKAKIHQFNNELNIIDKNKINPFLKYTINKYGPDFIQLYETK